ncbi:MAG TPA: hypothetical protein PK929_11315, partial [Quisquiliibacterium sp.]|nr:hypothetical protein [Quisquiliibacterium sp.]
MVDDMADGAAGRSADVTGGAAQEAMAGEAAADDGVRVAFARTRAQAAWAILNTATASTIRCACSFRLSAA